MKYAIVTGGKYEVEKEVEKYMSKGWVPQGGINITYQYSEYIYSQAMVLTPKLIKESL